MGVKYMDQSFELWPMINQTIILGIGFLIVYVHQKNSIKSLNQQIIAMRGTIDANASLFENFKKYLDVYDPDKIKAAIDLTEEVKELEYKKELKIINEQVEKTKSEKSKIMERLDIESGDKDKLALKLTFTHINAMSLLLSVTNYIGCLPQPIVGYTLATKCSGFIHFCKYQKQMKMHQNLYSFIRN
jgi:hypothetical protein